MEDEMGKGTGHAAQHREDGEFAVPYAPRDRAAERDHPQHVDHEMHPARMHHHVGEERGEAGEIAARQLERRAAVPRRDEG